MAPQATERLQLKVSHCEKVADDILSIELVDPSGAELPEFSAGSHIDVVMPNSLIRQYSLCNDPADRHRYCLAVLRESAGSGGSVYVHKHIKKEALVDVSAPRNSFHLVEDAGDTLLLAGGIGVTPILAMAHRLWSLGKPFEFHYCARSQSRMAFYSSLESLPFAEHIHVHFDDGNKSQLFDIAGRLAQFKDNEHLYVCGPTGFMNAVIDASEAANWPAGTVHREYFSNDPGSDQDNETFQVKIVSSGEIFDIPADRSIVEVLEEHDIDVPVSCEQGICGTCVTDVLEGEPDHRDLVLTDEERASNNKMTLCCSRAKSALLVLDL